MSLVSEPRAVATGSHHSGLIKRRPPSKISYLTRFAMFRFGHSSAASISPLLCRAPGAGSVIIVKRMSGKCFRT